MAVAYRSSSTVSGGTRSNTSFTAPSGIANNDILVILMLVGNSTTATAPSGFSTASGFPISYTWTSVDVTVLRLYVFYKVASSESGNYATTHGSAYTEGVMYAFSGGDTTTPISPTPVTGFSNGNAGDGATLTVTTITPSVDNSMVIWVGATWDDFGAANPPTGTTPTFTERYNPTTASSFYVAEGVLGTAGATGSKSVTSTQATDRPQARAMLVVQAAGGAAATWGPLLGLGNNRLVGANW
jgi:hypothetical protein